MVSDKMGNVAIIGCMGIIKHFGVYALTHLLQSTCANRLWRGQKRHILLPEIAMEIGTVSIITLLGGPIPR
jgi:hypothetical protein